MSIIYNGPIHDRKGLAAALMLTSSLMRCLAEMFKQTILDFE